MAGAAAMLRWGPSLGILPVLAFVGVALGLWKRPKATVAALTLLAFGVGMVRAATHQSVQPPLIDTFEQGIEVRVTGRVIRLPDPTNGGRSRLTSGQPTRFTLAPIARTAEGCTSIPALYSDGPARMAGSLRLYDPPPSQAIPDRRIDRPVVEIEVRSDRPEALPEPHSPVPRKAPHSHFGLQRHAACDPMFMTDGGRSYA